MKNRCTAFAAAVIVFLAAACENRQLSASLVINQIQDPGPADPVVHIALSDSPSFNKGYKYFTAEYDIASGQSPAVSFPDVSWQELGSSRTSREFWLLIAHDSNLTGVIDELDEILPAMRIVLTDGEELTVPIVDFDSSAGVPRFFPALFGSPGQYIRVFIENPTQVSAASPLYLRFGNAADLSAGGNFEIPIRSPELSSGFFINTSMTHAVAWIDLNGDGSLTSGIGELISSLPTSATALGDITTLILWSGQTY